MISFDAIFFANKVQAPLGQLNIKSVRDQLNAWLTPHLALRNAATQMPSSCPQVLGEDSQTTIYKENSK